MGITFTSCESLYCIPILVTYIILSTNYTSIKKKTDGKKKRKQMLASSQYGLDLMVNAMGE